MALISIKIKEFDNAKSYSEKAKNEANDYRDALNDKIISKMNEYSGSGSSNISNAKRLVNEKRTQLQNKADSFNQLQKDIGTLRTNIVNAETNLTNKIETVVGNFCDKYGLKSERSLWDKFVDFITPDWKENFFKLIEVSFKNWYRYNGGKEFLATVGKVIAVVIAVVALVAAVIALPGLVAALGAAIATGIGVASAAFALAGGIASVITLTIGLVTSIVQLGYSIQSFAAAAGDDPIWGRRYSTHSNEEDIYSTLRRNGAYGWATVLEVTNAIASIVSIVSSMGTFFINVKNAGGFKAFFANGIKNIKSNLKRFKTHPKETLKKLLWKGTSTDPKTGEVTQWYKRSSNWKTIKNGVQLVSNGWNILEGTAETLLGKDPNAFVSSLLESFGSTIDMGFDYLSKLSEKDLFTKGWDDYRDEAYDIKKGKENYDEKAFKSKTNFAKAAYDTLKGIQFDTSGGDLISTFIDDIPSLIGHVQGQVIGGTLSTLDFKFDDGSRFGDTLKDFTSFENLLPKGFELTGIEMPKGWMDGIVKTGLSITIDAAIFKGVSFAGMSIVNGIANAVT